MTRKRNDREKGMTGKKEWQRKGNDRENRIAGMKSMGEKKDCLEEKFE